MLALGLPSYPPNPQAGAHHGAIIAIPTAVRRTMHFGGRARANFMRGRRDMIRHWRPGHFVERLFGVLCGNCAAAGRDPYTASVYVAQLRTW